MENAIKQALSSIQTEDLLVEAARDMVKDEIKRYVRAQLESNSDIQQQISEAVREMMEAKMRERQERIDRAQESMDLGMVTTMPSDMRKRLSQDIARLVRMNQIYDKA